MSTPRIDGVKGYDMARIWANIKLYMGKGITLDMLKRTFGDRRDSLDTKRTNNPHVHIYDMATSYAHVDPNVRIGWTLIQNTGELLNRAGTRDAVNGYLETDSEVSFPFGPEFDRVKGTYLENEFWKTSPTVENSREVSNCWPLYHACQKLFLDFRLIPRGVDDPGQSKLYMLGANSDWIKRITIAERKQTFNDLEQYLSAKEDKAKIQGMKDKLDLEEKEEWLSYELELVNQQEGALIPRVLPGVYDFKLDSLFYYEPIDTTDRVNYKVTKEPSFYAEEALATPHIIAGPGMNPIRKLYLVPQYWQARGFFKAWYLFFSAWSFTFFVVPYVFQFCNRFPLFPRPFDLGTLNDYSPVWQWYERSRAHGRMYDAVHSVEFFTPFLAILFIFTSDGFYEIRRTNTFSGSLVGAYDAGEGDVYYIWRRVSTDRDLTIVIGQGPLSTSLINPWGANLIGGIPTSPTGVPLS